MVAQLNDLCMDHLLFVLIIFVGAGALDGWDGDLCRVVDLEVDGGDGDGDGGGGLRPRKDLSRIVDFDDGDGGCGLGVD